VRPPGRAIAPFPLSSFELESINDISRLSVRRIFCGIAQLSAASSHIPYQGLDRALAFTNELFLALEVRGHRVIIAPASQDFYRADIDERENPQKGHHFNNLWSPIRSTAAYIGTVDIGLTIIEMSEQVEARYVEGEFVRLTDYVPKRRGRYVQDHGWTCKHDFPTGRLCLQIYSPYPRAKWSRQWRETVGRKLSGRIRAIVRDLEKATSDIEQLDVLRRLEGKYQSPLTKAGRVPAPIASDYLTGRSSVALRASADVIFGGKGLSEIRNDVEDACWRRSAKRGIAKCVTDG
jgi:hypothetical protein